jgi:uncharacterized membrane protein (DUF106 family)
MTGKPGAAGAGGQPQQQAGSSQIMLLFMIPFIFLLFMQPELRNMAGTGMGFLLEPAIGFDAQFPVVTVLCASVIMVIFSTLIRHKLTNWVEMGKQSELSKFISEEFRRVRESGNPKKLEKVQELNKKVMAMSQNRMGSQMKSMIFTMIFAILIFMWLAVFIYQITSIHTATMPWDFTWDLLEPGPFLHIMPQWVLLYSVFSIPIGQVLQAGLKRITFTRRLGRIEAGLEQEESFKFSKLFERKPSEEEEEEEEEEVILDEEVAEPEEDITVKLEKMNETEREELSEKEWNTLTGDRSKGILVGLGYSESRAKKFQTSRWRELPSGMQKKLKENIAVWVGKEPAKSEEE